MLWWLAGYDRLPLRLEETPDVRYSIVSFWEIALKQSGAGFDFCLPTNWDVEIPGLLRRFGVADVTITPRHCRLIETLPPHHRDPFDRILLAQVTDGNFDVVSKDGWADAYGVGRVW